LFFSIAAFAELLLELSPVWAESFQALLLEKSMERKQRKFLFSCLIETATLVWLAILQPDLDKRSRGGGQDGL